MGKNSPGERHKAQTGQQTQVRFSPLWNGAMNAALNRLKGGARSSGTDAQAVSFEQDSQDATHASLPSPSDNEAPRPLPLNIMLEDSASDIVRRADELHKDANRLVARISQRIESEITLQVQGARALISFIWLGAGVWLYVSALNAQAADQLALSNGMPVDDAFVLMRTFFIVGLAGLGVAFSVATLVNAFGGGNNAKVRSEAEALGAAIAETAKEFDQTLTELRREMDRRSAAGDAVYDLSRAHLTALEACAYFRRMPFLTALEGAAAETSFRRFLSRPSGNPPPLPVFLGGAIVSYLFFYLFIYPHPPSEASTPLAITQYPWALGLIGIGAIGYAIIGFVFSVVSGALTGSAKAKAYGEALDALRGAFTAREAPRPTDVVRRIEDAVDVFRARVAGRARSDLSPGANQLDDTFADFSTDDGEISAWRRRDSSMTFVDTGFQAAPKQWRADAGAGASSGEPETKRGFFRLKKNNRD